MAQRTALITGVTGQDGSYLAEHLLELDYKVFGMVRRTSSPNFDRIDDLVASGALDIIVGDVTDAHSCMQVVNAVQPHEVYNLACQSFVGLSWDQPEYTLKSVGMGCVNMLEAVRQSKVGAARFYQASSSEMFGAVLESPQTETTRFNPCSPYGCAKAFAHYMVKTYRESYHMYACSGILFNHESPRRGEEFVTKKIVKAAARIACGLQEYVELGNLKARRDWGHAYDYVRAMRMMLDQENPIDYVVGTGQTFSIDDLVGVAFSVVGIDTKFRFVQYKDHDALVRVNPKLYRPADVEVLQANPERIYRDLGWESTYTFEALIEEMVKHEMDEARLEMAIKAGEHA